MESTPPSEATVAVLVPSEPVPEDAREVKGIDWTRLPPEHRAVIASFVNDLTSQGFQSSSIGDASGSSMIWWVVIMVLKLSRSDGK